MFQDLSTATAAEHGRTLHLESSRSRLARLAACCRPSQLRRRTSALPAWLRAGRLGPGSAPCCS
ncbi:MAG: hypothetical protein WCD35_16200 [Mycobacteriales bacterium]